MEIIAVISVTLAVLRELREWYKIFKQDISIKKVKKKD